jgi:hypothetical protein
VGPPHLESFDGRSIWVAIPLWAIALFFASYPIVTLYKWKFVKNSCSGHCLKCGYNLAGLTEPRCPECGTRFAPAVAEPESRASREN